jgi:hypothetical protein
MKVRLMAVVILLTSGKAVGNAAPNYPEKIDLPRDTSHPEQDCKRAIRCEEFVFIGVYSYAFTLPGVEGIYSYKHFSRHLRLKAIRGTSDVHRGPADDFINDRARIYALRYNRVVLGWTEKYHPDWLGPRESLTR